MVILLDATEVQRGGDLTRCLTTHASRISGRPTRSYDARHRPAGLAAGTATARPTRTGGAAREIDRLRDRDNAYRRICGGVGVGHLADCRMTHEA